MKWWQIVALWLVMIGAINWGLMLFNFNLVTWLVGLFPATMSWLTTLIYLAIGVSGVYQLIRYFQK